MSGFWELLVLDPGPSGPGASWNRGLVDPGRRGRIPYPRASARSSARQPVCVGAWRPPGRPALGCRGPAALLIQLPDRADVCTKAGFASETLPALRSRGNVSRDSTKTVVGRACDCVSEAYIRPIVVAMVEQFDNA